MKQISEAEFHVLKHLCAYACLNEWICAVCWFEAVISLSPPKKHLHTKLPRRPTDSIGGICHKTLQASMQKQCSIIDCSERCCFPRCETLVFKTCSQPRWKQVKELQKNPRLCVRLKQAAHDVPPPHSDVLTVIKKQKTEQHNKAWK